MRRILLLLIAACAIAAAFARTAKLGPLDFNFYGFVRADLFYNSRANEESVDGLFFMYPKDHSYDADGRDLNASPQGSFYALCTRLGVDIAGVKIGDAMASAKIEGDFRGSGSSFAVLRLRQAFVNLDWDKSALLIGQTWHPLSGEVMPSVLNLNTGSPFQPFNRSPMIRYRYTSTADVICTAAAIWQSQYNSAGPDGKSSDYIKYSMIPEFFAGVDYIHRHWTVGAGIDVLSLKPRKTSQVDGLTFKVSERITSVSAEAHVKYKTDMLQVSGKTALASNLTHCSTLGGYAVTSIDSRTGEAKYTPFHHSMTWLNFTYGKKWKPGLFVGYLKNLGTGKEIIGKTYGVGTDVDQVLNLSAQLTYNLPHWTIGLEATPCWAWYGSINNANGRIVNTHSVANYRILGVMLFTF